MVKQKIKELPDDLIVKILAKLPLFKESVATRLISKRHEEPWKLVPDVTFVDDDEESLVTFMSFLCSSLLSDDTQTLERLHLKLVGNYSASDINFWVQQAVNRSIRKLRFDLSGKSGKHLLVLPSCLSSCTTLKSLILRGVTIELVPRGFSLSSLKSLHLFSVVFLQSIALFLRCCPDLEYLVLHHTCYDWNINDLAMYWVRLSSLKSLHLLSNIGFSRDSLKCLLHSCPVLEYLVLHRSSYGWNDDELDMHCVRLSSLKSLHLISALSYNLNSLTSLLQSCPVLEYLVLNETGYGNWNNDELDMRCVRLSSLKSLHLISFTGYSGDSLTSLLQNCPVLEYLVLESQSLSLIPPESCLSSIKSLHLSSVIYRTSSPSYADDDIATVLKRCAALEDLVITRTGNDNVRLYNINVPTLKSLTINNSGEKRADDDEENHGFWINAPALETLNIEDTVSNFLMLKFMPEVTKANIEVTCVQSKEFIGSLTLIQHLSLCSPTSETPHRIGSIFPYLEHLELCTCSPGWTNLLASIISYAPRLQSLTLKSDHNAPSNDAMNFWNEPKVVPECLLMSLEIFEWRQYEDTVQQRKVAAYILANAIWLKMATFSTRSRDKDDGMPMQIKKLERVSETCQLVFE